MKLTVKKTDLQPALATVAKAVSPRSTLPVLANILVKADTELTLSATNLEMGIVKTISASVLTPGAITLPAKTFLDVVGVMDGDITISLNKKTMTATISAGASTMDLKGIDAEEFPTMTNPKTAPYIFPAGALKQAIDRTEFAACNDESRPAMHGIQFRGLADTLTLAATDGFRISVANLRANGDCSLIIPAKALREVSRLQGLEISCFAEEGRAIFESGDTRIMTQLIDGNFPDYQMIVPKPERRKTHATLMTAELLRAVKQAMIVAREGNNVIKFQFVPGGDVLGSIVVSAQSESTGQSETTITAEIEGEPLTVAFNGLYMAQALGAMDSFKLTFDLIANNAPGVMYPFENTEYKHVIMPMHLG